jgi:hypothetical protein
MRLTAPFVGRESVGFGRETYFVLLSLSTIELGMWEKAKSPAALVCARR